jgi:hypothetical protein
MEYQYYIMRRIPVPDGMTPADATCKNCYNSIKKEEKEETKQTQAQISQLTAELYKRTPEYKKFWDKNGIIQFKNDRIAILKRSWGAQVEFIIAFDDLTAEGYELKAIDEGKTADAQGITGGINSYYYFQKIRSTTHP